MSIELTPEMLEKAKTAKNAEELVLFAREAGIDLTKEKAEEYFERLRETGELSENELENVSGGCGETPPNCSKCGKEMIKWCEPMTHKNVWRCPFCSRIS